MWAKKGENKVGKTVLSARFSGKDGANLWPQGEPDIVGSTLTELEPVGKHVVATFQKPALRIGIPNQSAASAAATSGPAAVATTTHLLLCRGSGGGKAVAGNPLMKPLMKLTFSKGMSITIYDAGRKTNQGAKVELLDAAELAQFRKRRVLDVTGVGDVFDTSAVIEALSKFAEARPDAYLATALLDQAIFCGAGNGAITWLTLGLSVCFARALMTSTR